MATQKDLKKTAPKHIIIRLLKCSDKDKNLKQQPEEKKTYGEIKMQAIADFLSENASKKAIGQHL